MTSVIFEHFFILMIKQINKLKIIKIGTLIFSNQLEQSFLFSQLACKEKRVCAVKRPTDQGTYGWVVGYGPLMLFSLSIIILASGLLCYSNTLS